MRINRSWLGFLLFICMYTVQCIDYKPANFGIWEDIVVFADKSDWNAAADTFHDVFEKVMMTPQKEKMFVLSNISPEVYRQFRRQKNIIMFSSLESSGQGSKIVQNMLTPQVRAGVESGEYYVFIRKNEWAKNQLIMLLVARTMDELKKKMMENKEFLFSVFNDWVNENIKQSMYGGGEQKNLSNRLLREYKWTILLKQGYKIIEEDTENNVVWFRLNEPDRHLIVHWIPSKDGLELNDEWIIKTRNWIGNAYIDSMEVDDKYLSIRHTEFLERYAIHVEGLWKIESLVAGGPFQTWAFFHEQQKRIYFIDTMVFAPGKEKMPYIRELNIMARTFRTNDLHQ